MRLKKLFFGLSAFALMCSCTEDVLEEKAPNFKDGEAYISVRLTDVNSLTRATTSDGYAYGSANEHAVENAHFYFYDAEGHFVAQGSAWNGGQAESGEAGNIEFKSKTVVVLKGLTGNTYPKYMVTVLNVPSDFEPGATLKDMCNKLAGETTLTDGMVIGSDGKTYFTMSTTSYAGGTNTYDQDAHDDKYYFATVVDPSNFSPEPIDLSDYGNNGENGDIEPVTVYVERLAAKVSLETNLTAASGVTALSGKTYYEITTTVGGMDNEGGSATSEETADATEKMYVVFDGWRLNATAKDTYMSKNINTLWNHGQGDAHDLGVVANEGKVGWLNRWNDEEYKRSYWGMSRNYGGSWIYPDDASDLYSTDGSYDQNHATPLTYHALYKSDGSNGFTIADGCKTDFKDGEDKLNYTYCEENTNNPEVLARNFPSAVTSVIVAATVYNDKGEAADYVRYNGMLFTEDGYKKNILGNANLGLYKKTTEGTETKYTPVEASDVELEDCYDGMVKLVFTTEFKALLTDNTVDLVTEQTKETTEIDATTLAAKEAALKGNNGQYMGNGYKGGRMYYNIPIEHLNNAAVTDEQNSKVIPEGHYGVVRNHWYKITINSLQYLGKGIYDPEEVIVPDDEDKKYYLGADIQILSWKVVNQGVGL